MQFQLLSPFKVSPGQAKAIDQIIKNFATKDKQTLLGITGSGKSVVSDTDVTVRRNGSPFKEKIGPLIDNIFIQNKDKTKIVNDAEILDSSEISDIYEAYSLNPSSKKVEWKKIRQFVRHKSPKDLYRIESKCGRSITVTADHNFFILRNGNLLLSKTTDLTDKDFLPIPKRIEAPMNHLENISINDYIFREPKLFVSTPYFESALRNNREKTTQLMQYSKVNAISHKNEGITYEAYKKLKATDPEYAKDAKVGLFHENSNLPLKIKIEDTLLRFLGYYIAEGQGEKEYFIISSDNKEIIDNFVNSMIELKIHVSRRPEKYDFVGYSTVYSHLLKKWCGKDSGSKHLPDFWMQLSNKQLATLLQAYFSADGGVNGNTVSCTTESKWLASDLVYSLLRFGIVARTKKRTIRLPQKRQRLPYLEIHISGQKDLKTFQSTIGFALKEKNEALEKVISKFSNANADVIPANSFINRIRKNLDISQRELSGLAEVQQSYVSMIETGKRTPSREITKRLISAFYHVAKLKNANESLEDIRNLKGLLAVFWSPISKSERINGEEYVYDFAVENNETFLGGNGGIFVHNTFVMANVISSLQKPTLIIAHNKTLAAQLFSELKELFPHNRVEYFISFYDYYQPESYLPAQDMYIEKDSDVNEEIEKMRMHAVSSIVSRNDTIIVASISCIYSLGNPDDFRSLAVELQTGKPMVRQRLINALVDMQYERNDMVLEPGRFRVRGDVVDVVPAYENDIVRIELEGGAVRKIKEVNRLTGDVKVTLDAVTLYPARQYVVPEEKQKRALSQIEEELVHRLPELPPLEAQRLKQRTNYDLEMIRELGFCAGIENYSRHFDGRKPGEPPFTLMDYFPKDYLLIIDESHQTIPQSRAMYNGDYARKKNLVDFGFRLPSAIDNRPLRFEEFEKKMGKTLFVSATPAEYELEKSGPPVELITRPTGLLDPEIELHPIQGQMQHLMAEARKTISRGDRILITTLTKRMAEDLTDYLVKEGFRVRYLHSEVDSLDRIELVRQLRVGDFDILVGINLLREGLDIPEVATIFILDADKEGFLRDERSLIQTIGRAARNKNGKVVLYADVKTHSIKRAMEVTKYRRAFQMRFNKVHQIIPKTIVKSVSKKEGSIKGIKHLAKSDVQRQIVEFDAQMREAAERLDFEKAIQLRDSIRDLERSLSIKLKSGQKT